MRTVLMASSDQVAEALGESIARVGLLALGIWLLVSGIRRRGATQKAQGTGRVVAGSILIAFVVLGTLGQAAQQS